MLPNQRVGKKTLIIALNQRLRHGKPDPVDTTEVLHRQVNYNTVSAIHTVEHWTKHVLEWIETSLTGLRLADYVVLAAGVTFCLGYATINQWALRTLVMIGTLFYIWYYFIVTDTPQWAAIWTSVAMGLANVIGILGLWLRGSPVSIPKKHRDIYAHFNILPPGDFRKLMKVAKRQTLPAGFMLTKNNARVKTVYYVINGGVSAEKFGETFYLPDGIFLGEVGYLTGNRASATTMLTQRSDVLAWDVADLKNNSERDVRFKLAMDALISIDLADKVARAGSPRSEDQVAPPQSLNEESKIFHNPEPGALHLSQAGST